MATFNPTLIDGIANGTISKGQFVKYAAGGYVACSGITDKPDGVAFTDAVAAGAVCVQIGGKVAFICGAAPIADGALIATTAAGLGQTAVSTQYPRLVANAAVAAGAQGEGIWVDNNVVLP
jgi:hypothetical protein